MKREQVALQKPSFKAAIKQDQLPGECVTVYLSLMLEANSQSMSKLTKGGGVYCHRIKKNAILCLKTVIYTDMDLNFRDTGAFLSPSLINTYSISAGLGKKM